MNLPVRYFLACLVAACLRLAATETPAPEPPAAEAQPAPAETSPGPHTPGNAEPPAHAAPPASAETTPPEKSTPAAPESTHADNPEPSSTQEKAIVTEQPAVTESHEPQKASEFQAPASNPSPEDLHAKAPKAAPEHSAPAHTTTEAAHTPATEANEAKPESSAHAETPHKEAAGEEGKALPEEIASLNTTELLNYSLKALEKDRIDSALIGFKQLLPQRMPKAMQKQVLLGFARALRKKGDLTKSASVYEKLIKDFTLDAEAPDIYLELGRVQRALGAYKTAISRFYNVINSTIKLPEDGAARYRQLAKTAQFEIAETYFLSGEYLEASRFFLRLRLLDLAASDRARAHFKAAYSLQLAGDNNGAILQLKNYLELYPEDENVPEAYYCKSVSLGRLGRMQESLVSALELLKTEKARTSKDPKRWAYWQRKTGNQLANEFYDQGDFRNAVAIYTTLVELSPEMGWRLPLSYQIGLCQERLGQTDKAIATYKGIISSTSAQKADDPRKAEYADLSRMADWRLKQIEWQHGTERKLDLLLPPKDTEPATPTPST